MNEDFSDRASAPDSEEAIRSIFELQNDTLNVVGGFADFAYATARDDIMGTRPFFAATPEGIEDADQAEMITKHAHWKFGQSNLSEALATILYEAVNLGTSLPKTAWRQVEEVSCREETVLADAEGNPLRTELGEYFYPGDEEEFQPGIEAGFPTLRSPKDPSFEIPGETQWVKATIEQTDTVFDNAQTDCIHFDKFAADPEAPRLDLMETNAYHEFDLGLLDVLSKYKIPDSQKRELLDGSTLTEQIDSEVDRPESYNPASNPKIRLVEGYVRVDPFEKGSPVRIYIVFDPQTNTLLHVDYLTNVTPGGKLPISAVKCYPKKGSWLGVGFHERYERVQEYIDKQFSATGYRNRMHSNPINFLDEDALEDGEEVENILSAPGKTYKKKPGMLAKDILEFVSMPDLDNRTIEMMNIMMQVAQMRTGISSAAQGELSSLPDTNTATGVTSILSRAATLLKWPVGEMTRGLEAMLNYQVVLLYCNQNYDETFTWGEGRNAELLKLDHKAAKSLHYNVKVLLTQSYSRERLESSNAAIATMAQYAVLPELEKESQRPLYLQAISALGFENSEDIVRLPIQMPPEEAPVEPTGAPQQ